MVKNGNYFQRKCSVKTEEALAKKELHEAFGKQGFSELGTILLETIWAACASSTEVPCETRMG